MPSHQFSIKNVRKMIKKCFYDAVRLCDCFPLLYLLVDLINESADGRRDKQTAVGEKAYKRPDHCPPGCSS